MLQNLPSVEDPSVQANTLMAWLEDQPDGSSSLAAESIVGQLLALASQPRCSSGNACIRLCGFVQLAAKSGRPSIRWWAFGTEVTMRLFNFYIEWSEKDQHRSMRLVLDLLAVLIVQNPSVQLGRETKVQILQTLISISIRQSTRPLVKSSISCLNYLLTKSVCTLDDIASTYRALQVSAARLPSLSLWRQFVHEMFHWMNLHYVCPVAGRLLVTVFGGLREAASATGPDSAEDSHFTVEVWHQWLQDGLSAFPDILENIKLYIFVPLFDSDRTASLQLLEHLSRLQPLKDSEGSNLDDSAMLQLAALEVGKKSGLVEDPAPGPKTESLGALALNEAALDGVLGHRSPEIRSLALSVLISSSSPTRPYSEDALKLLRKYLPLYHSDSDTKFRYEVLSHTKYMVKRVKSTAAMLRRQIVQRHAAIAGGNIGSHREHVKPDEKSKTKKRPVIPLFLTDENLLQETLGLHERFLRWYVLFLRSELVPTASYQRHITALRATSAILKMPTKAPGSNEALDLEAGVLVFGDPVWVRSILDRIMDAFDDVRETATSLLMLLPEEIVKAPMESQSGGGGGGISMLGVLEQFCARANNLASKTARGDHADGAARAQGLLCRWVGSLDSRVSILSKVLDRLEAKLTLAERDLGHAAIDNPVHGDFASVRYIWGILAKDKYSDSDLSNLEQIQGRIVHCCQRIWQIVKHVLCDDSPEGHLPQEMEDVEGLDTKDLLSYAFRATIESSNITRTIISTLRFSRVKGTLCSTGEIFQSVGFLAFEQLSTLRHRGAFSTVSQTFTACCQLAGDRHVSLPDAPEHETLLMHWYKGTLDCIYAQDSTTRRSAGIPAMMTGILASNAVEPSFEEALYTLEAIALKPALVSKTDGSSLPQVHAMNCVRDVFRSSLLSQRAIQYLPRFLQLAVGCMKSEVWAIRNCGLLLLRSLIDCLFGTGDSRADLESGWDGRTMKISYARHPSLPDILLDLLKSGMDVSDVESQQRAAESVFPALDLIRRAGPPESHRDELYSCVVEYLGSHLWHVREMAARAVCSFVVRGEWAAALADLLDAARTSSNRLHGTFLATKNVLEQVAELGSDHLSSNLVDLKATMRGLARRSHTLHRCAEVQAAYLDVLNFMPKLDAFTANRNGEEVEVDDGDGEGGDLSPSLQGPEELKPQYERHPPSALLRVQMSIQALRKYAASGNTDALQQMLATLAASDVDTAKVMLEMMPDAWEARRSPDVASRLCSLYMDAAGRTGAPELRAVALTNLAHTMTYLLEEGRDQFLPRSETAIHVWNTLQRGAMNPALSHAILRVSGPLVATIARRQQDPSSLEHTLRAWGAMVTSAGDAENSFDTRYAAIMALKAFVVATGKNCVAPAYMPIVLAIYDGLVDDDDEIRDVAAEAAGAITGRWSLPAEAANILPRWMARHFGHLTGFRVQAVRRMVEGHVATVAGEEEMVVPPQWVPASSQLERALRFDDSLFAVEKQNLFLDEVREAGRWAEVFSSLSCEDGELAVEALERWAVEGMQSLIRLASRDDGPLGWMSTPEVFTTCSRILQSTVVLGDRTKGGPTADTMAALQSELRLVAGKSGVLGSLLSIVDRV